MDKYVFFLLGLPQIPSSRYYNSDAFCQKNIKMYKMLTSLGHTVYFYGVNSHHGQNVEEYCNSDNLHFVETHSVEEIAAAYGDGDNRFELGFDYEHRDHRNDYDTWPKKPCTLKYYKVVSDHINSIKKPDNFLLATMGYYFQPIIDAVQLFLTVESGIGYRGSSLRFRVFESAFLLNFMAGSEHPHCDIDGDFYTRIIPNYWDENEVEFSDEKDDYYLYVGRIIYRKGISIAADACKAVGKKLIIAGQGAHVDGNGWLIGVDFQLPPGSWEFVGYAGIEKRKKLMSRAQAVFVPTLYTGYFEGVHCEALLSGTPCLTTSYGVFGDGTFIDGVHGFKCSTMDDFVYAAKAAPYLDHKVIRKWAERYLLDNVKWQYQRYFDDLHALYPTESNPKPVGWPEIRKEIPEWRKALYPNILI